MKIRILSLALILIATGIYEHTDKRLKCIEKKFNAILESTKAPGFAVAIVEGDKMYLKPEERVKIW